jgi:hypothetical protein
MGLFDSIFGGNDASSDANEYLDQIPGILKQYLGPYADAGMKFLPDLTKQYGNLVNNPADFINGLGGGYKQSPGFNFALQQALQGANHAAAAGGMAGSPTHEQTNMGIATNLANQDYYNWLNHALGSYSVGLSGEQGLYNSGQQAGMNMGEDLASALSQQANYAYGGDIANQNFNSEILGQLIGLGGDYFTGMGKRK